jgi:hypothetical protein
MTARNVFAIAHSVGVAALLLFLAHWNWNQSVNQGRLIWAVSPKANIPAGQLISKDRLQGWFTFFPTKDDRAESIAETAGFYGTAEISGKTIDKSILKYNLVLAKKEPDSIVAMIEVSSNHTAALIPGMLLAFAREGDDKKFASYPSVQQIRSRTPPPLRLLGITPKSGDVTSLAVEIPNCAIPMAPSLASGVWRPIVLAQPR